MIKRIWKPLSLILSLGSLAVFVYFQIDRQERQPVGTRIGETAPDFTGTTITGETIRLSDFSGKIVVINNFATWCGPCLLETPHLVEVYNADEGQVVFIGLNMQETEKAVVNYKEQFGVSYPLVMDPDGKLTEIYHPVGLPTSWFIDKEGVVRYVHSGPMTVPMISEALDAVREGREPDVFSVAN